MPATITLRTERLILRPWCAADRKPFAALNADPEVMRYFPARLTRAESDAMAQRVDDGIRERGYGFWALEVRGGPSFIGFVGLVHTGFEAHFTPCVEIGWRLARDAWRQGYASEAARESLRFAFHELGLDEVVSFTAVSNLPSQKVMQRIGMLPDPEGDFDHPRVPEGHPLRRHVLYRLRKEAWNAPSK